MNKTKTKILILGATGMAGNMIEKVLSADSSFQLGLTIRNPNSESTYLSKGHEIHKFDVLKDAPFFAKNYDYIINCIGAIPSSDPTEEEYVKINTVFPIELAKNCKNSKIIHLTTDCVFDNRTLELNDEFSANYKRDYYAFSKHLGEVAAFNVLNLRCSIIGPERNTQKSFFERFLVEKKHKGWTDVEWNGITTYHLSQIIRGIIKEDLFMGGSQHIVPCGVTTRYEMMNVLNEFNWGGEKKTVEEAASNQNYNRKLTTVSDLTNFFLWKAAGYAAPLDFVSMVCELNKVYWKCGYAEERGYKFVE